MKNLTPESLFNKDQGELCRLMSEMNEEEYCASWMSLIEDGIWIETIDPKGRFDARKIEQCRELAHHLNGWIMWVDDWVVPDFPAVSWGPYFVPMSDWLEIFNSRYPKKDR